MFGWRIIATLLMATLLTVGCAVPTRPRVVEPLMFVIPPGTAAAEMAGEPTYALPPRVNVAVGQPVVIRNDDRAMHYLFDSPIAPGQTFTKVFNTAGEFRYAGAMSCSIAPDKKTGVIFDVRAG
jgi:hypothetical protein